MKAKLIHSSNQIIEFDLDKIMSITAHGNMLYVKLNEHITHTGYRITVI